MTTPQIVILHGDETGEEMLIEALRCVPASVEHVDHDLSLENRLATENACVYAAGDAIKAAGTCVKAATITEHTVGSPNLILREIIDADVIVRSGRQLPGVPTKAGVQHAIHVVRMATGEAYGALEIRHGKAGDVGEIAQRTETITRGACRAVSEYAFILARAENARVFGGPKWTVSAIFENMLKEEMDRAAAANTDVEYWPMLIDATYAGLINGSATDRPVVVPSLNRDGDCLADLVLPMFGSIAGAGSQIVAFDADYCPVAKIHEAAHGTAPSLLGKNMANPLAMILACSAAMDDLEGAGHTLEWTGQQLRDASMQAISDGVRTGDLGGSAPMSGFVDAVLARVHS